MKRKLISLILCLMLLSTSLLTVFAASPFIQDYANLLGSAEEEALSSGIAKIQQNYNMDVVILTIPNLMGKSPQSFADDFYENNRYSPDGLLFLIDMGSLQWYISTSGAAIEALSDRELDAIDDAVVPYLSDGRFYEGFDRFLDILPGYLKTGQDSGISLLISLLIGAVIAGIVVLILRSTMNTRKPQHSAENYLSEGSWQLYTHQDLFLYSNVTKRPRPQNNSSGSSTHRSSSGRSHGGRGGSF